MHILDCAAAANKHGLYLNCVFRVIVVSNVWFQTCSFKRVQKVISTGLSLYICIHSEMCHLHLTHAHESSALFTSGVVNWKTHAPWYKQMYRVPFTLATCSQCGEQFKDSVGYTGTGRRGEVMAFYSENDMPGVCSINCFYDSGGSFHDQ